MPWRACSVSFANACADPRHDIDDVGYLQAQNHLKSIIGNFDTMDAVDTSATTAALRKVVASAPSKKLGDIGQPARTRGRSIDCAVRRVGASRQMWLRSRKEKPPRPKEAAQQTNASLAHEPVGPATKNGNTSVRVSLTVLDKLMTLGRRAGAHARNALLKKTTRGG